MPRGPNFIGLKNLLRDSELHTVCQEARCPNIGECFNRGTATFMILGDTCTRACGFCAVTSGRPGALDWGEPARLAASVERLGLNYVYRFVGYGELADFLGAAAAASEDAAGEDATGEDALAP